ncbi:hypothetical protein [Pedobacter insulae]|uniref:Uncharacterized protein n=1 Tax=Pedobacter insulae TaxID=414048 RepID=A0A1I2XBB3_9SPHI|nr:hypothetical protein [Pedobacter insulae]SFH10327.1 hypothetical protein SAMN04489864_10593 [Pedobacter insulae]
MQQPFDLTIGPVNYAIFPEGNHTYVVFKDGKEYLQIQKDDAAQWIKFDKETGIPLFELDEEVNQLGKLIDTYQEDPDNYEDEMDLE